MTAADVVNAEKLFGTLAHITTSQLPQSRLLSLLGSSRSGQYKHQSAKCSGPKRALLGLYLKFMSGFDTATSRHRGNTYCGCGCVGDVKN